MADGQPRRSRNPLARRNRTRRYSDPIPSYSSHRVNLTPAEKDSLRAFFAELKLVAKKRNLNKPTKPGKPEPEVPKPELVKKLHVKGVDLRVEENIKAHHTGEYDCTKPRKVGDMELPAELVIRRGKEFKMTIDFDRPYNIKKNDITLMFNLGDDGGRKLNRTVKLDETKPAKVKKTKWSAHLVEKMDKSVTVSVFIPADAPVGEWELTIRTIVDTKGDKDEIWQYRHSQEVIVLFNPWCKDDAVYMESEVWLNEAVLNDHGCIYRGHAKYNHAKKWFFGQFEDGILDVSLHLLRKAFSNDTSLSLGYPQRVVRALSAVVNSNDDDGVLTGNWSGEYGDGASPSDWSGSVKILKKYAETRRPVKYGQCWVFSGVLTTVCRALGIPCRSVTNFASAHNTDTCHLSCDTVNKKDYEGNWFEDKIDSVWNFHVWNEAWMTRGDLKLDGKDYSGWQVIDATPQETSDNIFQCGPSPLKAIKEGELNVGSDTAFIFAEVNGDKVDWLLTKTKTYYQMSRVKDAIGKNISTHQPTGKPLMEGKEVLIITDLYKYGEGSAKEREIVKKAERMFRCAEHDDDDDESTPPPVVELEMKLHVPEEASVGKSVPLKLTVENKGRKAYTVILSMDILYVDYRNEDEGTLGTKKTDPIKLNPLDKKELNFAIDVETSLRYPQYNFVFQINGIMEVVELDGFPFKETDSLTMDIPDVDITGPKQCKRGETIEVVMKFTNPLAKPLTNCMLEIEGNMKPVDGAMDMKLGTIPANETWSKKLKLKPGETPVGSFWRTFQPTVTTKELGALSGYHIVTYDTE